MFIYYVGLNHNFLYWHKVLPLGSEQNLGGTWAANKPKEETLAIKTREVPRGHKKNQSSMFLSLWYKPIDIMIKQQRVSGIIYGSFETNTRC